MLEAIRGRVTRLLLRPNAREHVSGAPNLEPGVVPVDVLWEIASEPAPANTRTGRGGRPFYGSITGPIPYGPPPFMDTDAPPTTIVADYSRARHGFGLFDVEPLIPEGETEGEAQ